MQDAKPPRGDCAFALHLENMPYIAALGWVDVGRPESGNTMQATASTHKRLRYYPIKHGEKRFPASLRLNEQLIKSFLRSSGETPSMMVRGLRLGRLCLRPSFQSPNFRVPYREYSSFGSSSRFRVPRPRCR